MINFKKLIHAYDSLADVKDLVVKFNFMPIDPFYNLLLSM